MNTSGAGDFSTGITPVTINTRGYVGLGPSSAQAQLHVWGYGQAAWGLTTNNPSTLGGTIFLQDINGAYGNGGAVVFGASQGYFAAVKGLLTDGSYNTRGALSFQIRLTPTDATLTDVMRIYSAGSTAWVGLGNTQPAAPLDFGVSAANNKLVIGTYTNATVWSGIGMDTSSCGVRIAGDFGLKPVVDFGNYSTDGSFTWTSLMKVLGNGSVVMLLPGSNPGAGSKQLWYDPATGHVMYAA
jgi:hypothetical protein